MKNEDQIWAEPPVEAAETPQIILHYKLLIDETHDQNIVFSRTDVTTNEPVGKIAEYAQTVANSAGQNLTRNGETPYDLPAHRPAFIVVELDVTKTGWQFETGHRGITPKPSGNGKLHGLKHVYGADGGEFDTPPRDGCRVVYFGVKHRNMAEKCEINLHTEFLQDGKRLKIIIDPDVPNLGDPPPLNPPPPRD